MKKSLKFQPWMFQPLAAAAVFLGFVAPASAGFVPVLVSENTSPNSSTFNYDIRFATNGGTESLSNGDFFTLYDIGTFGFTPGSINGTGINGNFSLSNTLTGRTPAFTAPPDSPMIGNITLTYGGATLTTDTTFQLSINYNAVLGTTTGYFSSADTTSLGKNAQSGLATLPQTVVPEPSTWALAGLGIVLGGLTLRRRAMAA